MSRSAARLLYWSPRILTICFALLLGAFALDVFGRSDRPLQTLLAFFIHLLPAVIVLGVLLIAWRWEWVGAALFTGFAAYYAKLVLPRHFNWAVTILTPLLLIAALFLFNWIERAKVRSAL